MLNVYSYKNWFDGEVVDGPHLTRYWCEISLMYPYDRMPDPAGGERLLARDCKVSYKQDHYMEPRRVESPDDYENGKIVSLSKEFVREHYLSTGHYEQLYAAREAGTEEPPIPPLPDEIIRQTSELYATMFERLTGQEF